MGLLNLVLAGLAKFQDIHLGGSRGDAFFEQPLAQNGVDKGALPGIELADHHQQKQLIQLLNGATERGLVFFRRAQFSQNDLQVN